MCPSCLSGVIKGLWTTVLHSEILKGFLGERKAYSRQKKMYFPLFEKTTEMWIGKMKYILCMLSSHRICFVFRVLQLLLCTCAPLMFSKSLISRLSTSVFVPDYLVKCLKSWCAVHFNLSEISNSGMLLYCYTQAKKLFSGEDVR